MGLLDWLTGKSRGETVQDRIWLTQKAKYAGIHAEVAQAVADPAGPSAVIVVAHFNDCLEQLQTAVGDFDRDRVLVASADALAGRTATELTPEESRSILIIMGERHPLPSRNDAVVDFARSLPCRWQIVCHVSLEDPLLKRFLSGEWTKRVLQGLGMKADEAIESRMVSYRIRSALEEIAKKATGDAPANSAEEWLERNCP